VPQKPSVQVIERPAICSFSRDVLTASNVYMKSFCIVEWPQNYEDSKRQCLRNGMKLFKFDSMEANRTVSEFIRKQYQKVSYFYLDGVSERGCENVNNFNGNFTVTTADCSSLMFSVCEYSTTEPTDTSQGIQTTSKQSS
jgi:hypothetical protein